MYGGHADEPVASYAVLKTARLSEFATRRVETPAARRRRDASGDAAELDELEDGSCLDDH